MKFLSQINVNTEYTLPFVDGTNGQVLTTDGNGAVYWGSVSAGVTNLNALTDVELTSPTSGQILRYEFPPGGDVPIWRNVTPNYLTPNSSINALGDVTITSAAAGQILQFNGTYWINTTLSTVEYVSKVQHTVKAGVAITKGQAVYVTSADGTNMIVGLASNAAEATSSKVIGLAASNAAINDQIFVVTEGLLAGLNTSTATAGDPVWLGVDGNLIFGLLNKPVAPAHLVYIGVVTRVQSNNGEIFVNVQNGFELNEIHDALIVSPTAGQLLRRDSDNLWKNWTPNFLTSFTETDPTVPSHVKSITATNISNWNAGYNDSIRGIAFNTTTGVVTLTQQDGGTLTVDLDGRYLESFTETDTLATVTGRGATTTNAITVGGLIVDTNTLVVDATNDRVGIGRTSPLYKIDVAGNARFDNELYVGGVWSSSYGPRTSQGNIHFQDWNGNVRARINTVDGVTSVGNRRLSLGILDINSGGTPEIKINTKIPFALGGADFTVNIKGFQYGGTNMVSLSIGWHYYLGQFYSETAISNGSFSPTITLGVEPEGVYAGCVVIHLSNVGYWPKLYVESVYSSAYADDYVANWSWSDAAIDGLTDISVVAYKPLETSITGSAGYATNAGNSTTTSQTNFTTLTLSNAAVATQAWVQTQGYLTSLPAHNHDDRYYTETESDARFYLATNPSGYITSSGNTSGYSGSLSADDNRTISPSEIGVNQLKFGFTSWSNNNSAPWADFLHLRSYGDHTGGSDNLIMFKKSGIGMRIWQQTFGSSTAYSSYADVWTTDNFSSTDVSNWNAAYNDKINSASFNTADGVLTLTQQDGGTVTVDLDGRYVTSATDSQSLIWDVGSKSLSITNGNTVTLDGLATEDFVTSQGYLTSLPSHNHDDRYYTESESDSRFVNASGDTMNGSLSFDAAAVIKKKITGVGDNPVKTASGVLASRSDNGGGYTYYVIETNVPQDDYQMGGFTIELLGRYGETNHKTKIDLGGYWNAESNSGFIGFEAHGTNPQYKPTIEVARNSAGKTAFIIYGVSWSYPVIVARDLWLGYSQTDGGSYGEGWSITGTNDVSSYTNKDTVVWRNAYSDSNPAGYITGYTETDTLATVTGRGNTTTTGASFGGNVGIGTTSPSHRLHVTTGVKANSVYIGMSDNFTTRSGDGDNLYIKHPLKTSGGWWGVNVELSGAVSGHTATFYPFRYLSDENSDGSADTIWSFIDKNGGAYFAGNVGIGNTNPTAKLQVGPEAHPSATGIEVAAGVGGANLIAIGSTHHNWFPYTDGNNYYSAGAHNFRSAEHGTPWVTITASDFTWGGNTVATRAWVQAQGYLTSDSDSQDLTWDQGSKTLGITNGNSVVLENLATEDYVTSQGYVTSSHTHTISQVTGLQTALDGKLSTSGKAADSELIDGIDSSRIIYGDGGFGSTSWSDMNNTAQKSGFFFYNQPTGNPFNDWTHWINSMGNSWNPNYGFQLAHAFHSDRLAVRVVANGGWGSWRTVIDSGNIGSQSVLYATNATRLYASDSPYRYGDQYPYYMEMRYDGTYWNLSVTPATPSAVRVAYADSAGTASSSNTVTGKSSISYAAHSAGANDYNLELYSSDTGDATKYVSLRFHQGSRYWGQIRYNNAGFRLTGGADDSLNNLYAGIYYATGGNSTNWNAAYGWGNHADAPYWNVSLTDAVQVEAQEVIFAGNVTIQGTLTESSSIRFKENIAPLEPSLDKVNQLEAISYNKIGEDNREIGLIAEDVAELFPEVVTYNEEGQPQGIQYQRLSVILLKAVQELSQEVNELKKKLN